MMALLGVRDVLLGEMSLSGERGVEVSLVILRTGGVLGNGLELTRAGVKTGGVTACGGKHAMSATRGGIAAFRWLSGMTADMTIVVFRSSGSTGEASARNKSPFNSDTL